MILSIQHKFILSSVGLTITIGQMAIMAPTAFAQGATMSDKAMERSRFYQAPREYQIVDERPVIRDFREGPIKPGQIGLPPGPGGGGGPGAGGLGNLGGGAGGNTTLPAGGLPVAGGSEPAYKDDPTGMSTLPKSGFGGSNIPAHGVATRGILPGVTMGVVGKLMSQKKPVSQVATPARALAAHGPTVAKPSIPTVASYGGYGNSPTTYGGPGLRETKNVRGYLLNKH